MTKTFSELVQRLRDEADLCRAETANDVAALLEEAANAIEYVEKGWREERDSIRVIQRRPT